MEQRTASSVDLNTANMAQSGEQIPPALKAWLDNVIVPALVKEWLAEEPERHGVTSGAKSHDAES